MLGGGEADDLRDRERGARGPVRLVRRGHRIPARRGAGLIEVDSTAFLRSASTSAGVGGGSGVLLIGAFAAAAALAASSACFFIQSFWTGDLVVGHAGRRPGLLLLDPARDLHDRGAVLVHLVLGRERLEDADEVLLVGRRNGGPPVRLGQLHVGVDRRGGARRVLPARGLVERVRHEPRDARPRGRAASRSEPRERPRRCPPSAGAQAPARAAAGRSGEGAQPIGGRPWRRRPSRRSAPRCWRARRRSADPTPAHGVRPGPATPG